MSIIVISEIDHPNREFIYLYMFFCYVPHFTHVCVMFVCECPHDGYTGFQKSIFFSIQFIFGTLCGSRPGLIFDRFNGKKNSWWINSSIIFAGYEWSRYWYRPLSCQFSLKTILFRFISAQYLVSEKLSSHTQLWHCL